MIEQTMDELPTRDKLLLAAVNLFALKGYDATSVDEIAESIGIKGPNIYKYYKGKAALLETIIAKADSEYNERMGLTLSAASLPTDKVALKAFTLRQLDFTFNNPWLQKLRRIISTEQYRSAVFAECATRHQLTNMQEIYARIFEGMMQNGHMQKADARTLALAYIAPVTLMLQLSDRSPESRDYAMDCVRKHIDCFTETYIPE